jgi:hypothetical protein
MGGSAAGRKFVTDGSGPIRISRPKPDATKYKGLSRVVWFEVPLAAIGSPEALQTIVDAVKALYGGNEAEVLKALRNLSTD